MEQSKFYQIKNITEQEYTLVGCDGSVITRPIQDVDKSASAFTIQDAKDGDVLCVKYGNDEMPFIFTGKQDDIAYCALNSFGEFVLSMVEWLLNTSVLPATKEQRDLLFQKMKEAGYEWDAEKKELKKIKQKPVEPQQDMLSQEKYAKAVDECIYGEKSEWSEEDEKMYKAISIALSLNDAKGYLKSWYTTPEEADNWLKSLKDRVQPQPKQEWSEEDERIIEALIAASNDNVLYGYVDKKKLINWLKSLRLQPNQKWNEEDDKILDKLYYILGLAAETPCSNRVTLISDKESIKLKNWLKSLRPQKQWKPSEEQMEALRIAGEIGSANNSWAMCILKGMYQDLKKLRGK